MVRIAMVRRVLALVVMGVVGLGVSGKGFAAGEKVLSWGDQGDGTYKNPVLKSDYSDPDLIRVGSDFYLIASDFHFSTMQILHSKDLVNWELAGKVFDRLPMGWQGSKKYDEMNGYGEGTWAPSIRFHDGEFYVYVCTPWDGLFMWHTKNAKGDVKGPWSEMVTVKAVQKWEDPCPFWDEDGQAYLVHGLKGAGPLMLHKMSADGTTLLDEGKEIYRGQNAEGPKMMKRGGYYYISLPEGGFKETGVQVVLRSKEIYGPYERKVVLNGAGEHQGGFVDLDNGESWFIGFKEQYGKEAMLGRIDYLEPVKWGADGWPVFGYGGKPVAGMKKPDVGAVYPIARPVVSDEFDSGTLGLQWQWNHNPVEGKWSLSERPGYLRLHAMPAESLVTARDTLTEKLWDRAGVFEAKMEVGGMVDGQRAGVMLMWGKKFGWVGVKQEKGEKHFEWDGGNGAVVSGDAVWLRAKYEDGVGTFSYSVDGKTFVEAGVVFKLGFANWKGSRPGVYSFGSDGGWVDVDWVRYGYRETVGDVIIGNP